MLRRRSVRHIVPGTPDDLPESRTELVSAMKRRRARAKFLLGIYSPSLMLDH